MNFSRKAAIFFFFFFFLKLHVGNSLTVQWLGLGTFTAMTWVQFLAGKLRSHKLHGQKKKKKKIKKGYMSKWDFFHTVKVCCCCQVASVVSDSVRPHRWQPTRLCRPWDSPGKNTGVGCHFLLQQSRSRGGLKQGGGKYLAF